MDFSECGRLAAIFVLEKDWFMRPIDWSWPGELTRRPEEYMGYRDVLKC